MPSGSSKVSSAELARKPTSLATSPCQPLIIPNGPEKWPCLAWNEGKPGGQVFFTVQSSSQVSHPAQISCRPGPTVQQLVQGEDVPTGKPRMTGTSGSEAHDRQEKPPFFFIIFILKSTGIQIRVSLVSLG